uniref:Uncharacterized protein n=1 Tax=Nothoprocta perdicaria TaxID=30464 RepID=A0A8C6ZZ56_NOTPE
MLGLQDWPTQSCAGGSPLFCSLLSGGRKCSTDPLSVHKTSAARESNTRNSPTPGPSGGREELLFVPLSNLVSLPLTCSIVHVPSHMGSKS